MKKNISKIEIIILLTDDDAVITSCTIKNSFKVKITVNFNFAGNEISIKSHGIEKIFETSGDYFREIIKDELETCIEALSVFDITLEDLRKLDKKVRYL